MRRGEPMAHNDVQFCTNIIYNEKEFVFLIVERKEGYIGHTNERMDRICTAANHLFFLFFNIHPRMLICTIGIP